MPSTLDRFLNVYWLRPETALWRSIDTEMMKPFKFVSPSLDLGCGDGVFSFLRAGGDFDPSFDAFQSVARTGEFFNNVDIFDHYDKQFTTRVRKSPDYSIDVAFDHKVNLLHKARDLGFYRRFVSGDGNRPLPFATGSFQTVFSNILYWLDQPCKAFSEIARVLAPRGQGCVMLPDTHLKEFSFYYTYYLKTLDERFRFLEFLDRGRLADNVKNMESGDTWKRHIESAGLRILYHRPFLSKTLFQIWDIGLRPLFPVLHKMVSHIPPESLLEIKQEWIETLKKFLAPIAHMDSSLSENDSFSFHCFIFQK